MSRDDSVELAKLRAQNLQLNEQVRLLFRTEQRLHRYQAELDRQLERIRLLNEFGLEAASGIGSDDILRLAANAMLELVPSDFALVYQASADDAGISLTLLTRIGGDARDDDQPNIVLRHSELPSSPTLIDDDPSHPHEALRAALSAACPPVGSAKRGFWMLLRIAAPSGAPWALLAIRKEDRGALGHERLPTVEDEPFLRLFTAHVETAISNALSQRSLVDAVAARTSALEQANRELRVLHIAIESVADAIEVCDGDGHFQYVNPAFEKLTGYAREDVLGKTPFELFSDATAIPSEASTALAQGQSWVGRIHGRQRGGAPFEHDVTMSPVVDDESRMISIVAVRRDVAERRKIEDQLRLSEHMASVGRLAAGMAHEINNPLAYISLNLGYLYKALNECILPPESETEIDAALDEARKGADRVAGIVRDLMTFSRADKSDDDMADLEPVVRSAARMAGNEIRHKAKLVLALGETPVVSANARRVGQLVVNLLINAAQAIEDGAAEENEIRVTTSTAPDGQAVIEVRDSGRGMGPEVTQRIFDPFFTTKAVGEGTGLGLSICHGIVMGAGGTIHVESEPGSSSRFIVTLPAKKIQHPTEQPPPSMPAPAARGKILVIDDEYAVGKSIQRVLRHHDVTFVTSAREGLTQYENGGFHLVLCDLMMPEMSGSDFFEHISDRWPGAENKVVFITGGAFTTTAQEFLQSLALPWFRKPFDVAAFEKFVNKFIAKSLQAAQSSGGRTGA